MDYGSHDSKRCCVAGFITSDSCADTGGTCATGCGAKLCASRVECCAYTGIVVVFLCCGIDMLFAQNLDEVVYCEALAMG
jgi:hypothetical protein